MRQTRERERVGEREKECVHVGVRVCMRERQQKREKSSKRRVCTNVYLNAAQNYTLKVSPIELLKSRQVNLSTSGNCCTSIADHSNRIYPFKVIRTFYNKCEPQ